MARKKRNKPEASYGSTYLRQWRFHRGKRPLTEVAEKVGLTHGQLSKIERGEQPYNQGLLEQLAKLYRCEVVDLLIRDPLEPEAIWSLWARANPSTKRQIVGVAETLIRTGTED